MYAQDSIDLLQNSGLQFREHEEHGIEPLEFAELLMSSGKLDKICKLRYNYLFSYIYYITHNFSRYCVNG